MANTYLQKQTALAKKIRVAHPKMKWTDCIKKAALQLKGKRVGAYKVIEKNETIKTKPKAVYQITRGKSGTFKKNGVKKIAGVKVGNIQKITSTSIELDRLNDEIANLQSSIKTTVGVSEKNKIRVLMGNRKKQFYALKKYFNTLATFKK